MASVAGERFGGVDVVFIVLLFVPFVPFVPLVTWIVRSGREFIMQRLVLYSES